MLDLETNTRAANAALLFMTILLVSCVIGPAIIIGLMQ